MVVTEQKAREMTTCPKCGEEKRTGQPLCWGCFKYIDNPWKYSKLSLKDWLAQSDKIEFNLTASVNGEIVYDSNFETTAEVQEALGNCELTVEKSLEQ